MGMQYRWNVYKGVRNAIDQNEGGLEKFSQGECCMTSTSHDLEEERQDIRGQILVPFRQQIPTSQKEIFWTGSKAG